jgi:glycosyltransferase involved in cell wall biosynthesis
MYVRERESEEKHVRRFQPSQNLVDQLSRLGRYAVYRLRRMRYMLSEDAKADSFTDDRSRFADEIFSQLPAADVYHLHWVSSFVDIRRFFDRTTRPIVWTLHDMNPFTGGCHYTRSCERYLDTCGRCPQLGSSSEHDLSRAIFRRKEAALEPAIREERLHIVAPSHWLAEEAQASRLLGDAPIHMIPHGLDTDLFRPVPSSDAGDRLDIPPDHKVVLFIAESTDNERKGGAYLAQALKAVEVPKTTVLSIGKKRPDIQSALHHVHAGYINDDRELAALYSLADFAVVPSLQEAFGQTVLEAMACGTPVVGFAAGGVPDMIRPGETGWLSTTRSVSSLREKIYDALTSAEARKHMAQRCRDIVEEEYTLGVQAKRHIELYESILACHDA